MTDTIAVKWNIEDASETELEIGEQTEMRISDIVDAFAEEDVSAIPDADLEEYIKDCVGADFQEKIGPVVGADHLAEVIAAVRAALEKARTA